ncbi:MAG: sigma-70 family RNA polymerase sigma factor [Candidatus Uhrbacteria bacterium]
MLRAARGVLPHGFHGAEDAVQEAQRRCYQLIDSHACAIGLRRWACTIAKNEALRLLGRAARHVADPEALEKRLITHSLESNWANEGLRDVKRAADEATDDDQAVLVTLALQWGHAETAQHLGIPVGSVSGRVRAVRVRLARRLELVEVALALTTSISIDGNLDANDAGRQ